MSPDSAILDADTFRRVLAALEERRARVASLRRTPHADRPLLDGIAVCAPCSGPLRRSMTRGYVSYTCANAAKGKCAARVTVAAPTLDAHVVLTFLDVLGTHPRTRLEQSEDGRVSARLVEIRAEVADTAAAFATAPASEIPSLAGRMSALREAEARLLADADAAPVYAVVPTKMTWAETWASTAPDDVTSRRSLLAEAMHSVTVSKPPIAGARVPIADRVEVVWDPSVRPPFPPTPLSSRPRDFIVPHDATSLAALAQVAPPFSPDSEGARFLLRVAAGVHNDLAAVGSTMHAAQIGMAADLAVPLDEEAAFVDLDLFTEGLGTEAALEAVGVRLGVALVAAAQAW